MSIIMSITYYWLVNALLLRDQIIVVDIDFSISLE